MATLAAVGLQWGDEGKGKIIDVLSEYYDIVVRFQGGSNAGHTVIIGDKTFKFRIMPSGAVRGKTVVIGNGVVVDPRILLTELGDLERNGLPVNLVLSERAHIITPYHIQIDGLIEEAKGSSRVGTTKRGIGPTYADKISRIGLRVCDLLYDPTHAWDQFERLTNERITRLYGASYVRSPDEVFQDLTTMVDKLAPYVADTGHFLVDAMQSDKHILLEGAQGTLLDVDHGTYPYVTSSNCVSGAAATGSGIPPTSIDAVLGISKAYVTRVGAGPFPTEIEGDTGVQIQERGGEFGTVTGRPRRCGWLDLVALKYATRLNGADYLAITKIDVLSGINPLKVCVAYDIDGTETTRFPATSGQLNQVTPVYEELSGWDDFSSADWSRMKTDGYDSLPSEIHEYLAYIEQYTGSRVAIISIGPARTDTIMVPDVADHITYVGTQ